jgi:hypothetical protein
MCDGVHIMAIGKEEKVPDIMAAARLIWWLNESSSNRIKFTTFPAVALSVLFDRYRS